jgi:2',3'-cyclic-nucleotide 2'-phosphodiesterase (5'-nucleotidase family)
LTLRIRFFAAEYIARFVNIDYYSLSVHSKLAAMKIRILLLLPLLVAAYACTPEPAVSESTGLTFIHMNDTYRVADVEDGTRGGLGRVATIIRQLQAQGREVHVLHGGDLLSPSLESQIWYGGQMVQALNFIDELAPAYFIAGNHEFDIRDSDLAYFVNAVRSSDFDWVGDNYRFKTGDEVADSSLETGFTFAAGGKTIGVFAVTLHPQDGGTERSYVEYDHDYMATAQRAVAGLELQGVDMIIGLTHLYMKDDILLATLREEHPKLEFIVGGHDHEMISQAQSDESAAIFKGSSNARVVWRIDVDFDADGDASIQATAIPMDNDVAKDSSYQELEDQWRADLLRLYPIIDVKVGMAGIRFDVTEESIRNAENPWGDLIVDVARSAFGQPKSDFAFINSGSIRIDDYIADDITYEDIARTFGFPSQVRRINVSGTEFKTMMEAGYRGAGRSEGFFPQVSGFRVCVDRRKPDKERIVSLQVDSADGWTEIDSQKIYSVILPNFIFGDRDGYAMPPGARETASPPGPELKYLLVDAIVKAQFENKTVGVEVDPANPRYMQLDANRESCWDHRENGAVRQQ